MEDTRPSAQAESHAAADAEARSLGADLRLLAERGRTFAEAELAFQQARGGYAARQIKTIALLGVFAFLFVFFSLMALTVGMVIALTPILTAWGATAVVAGALLLLALLLVLMAAGRWRGMIAALTDGKP